MMSATNSPSKPQLTIGLPVRNGGSLLSIAIESLLKQTFRDFTLLISDNASDDQTQSICEHYAAMDDRIRYIRQPVNLGNPGNFRFTLMQAKTEYFMWAAHDDIWLPTFAERNIELLNRNPRASSSVSRVEFMLPDGEMRPSNGTAAICGTPVERVRKYLQMVGDSSRFYSVYRTAILQRCYHHDIDVFGFDWIASALVLVEGDNLEVDTVLLRRMPQSSGHYFRTILKQLEGSRLDRLFPLRQLTLKLRKYLPADIWRACAGLVLRHNIVMGFNLLEYRLPFTGPAIRKISTAEKALRRMFKPPLA
jgi:glycosyltransferase involved in cell wall biosynthesis